MTKPAPATSSAASAAKARKPVAVRAATSAKKGPRLDGLPAAHRWLLDRVDIERMSPSRLVADALKLDRMERLVELLDNPHRAVRTVHIAGTKGKGSTCEMTAACLEACGYTVGVYTSPHLLDMRERIRINRKLIGPSDFVRIAQQVADAAANLPEKVGEPTFFELITAMAFVRFAEEAVDVAVIEVGLGGRLDSTNVITPEVTAITSISLDHTQILGATVEKIAAEKAGIFKPGVPAVSAAQADAVLEVLRGVATERNAPLHVLGKEIDFSVRFDAQSNLGPHHRVSLTSPRNNFDHLLVPLKGEHQAHNCGVALAILDKLCERGFKTPATKVTQGLATTQIPGRLEELATKPRIVLDGAHNADSMKWLMKTINAHLSYDAMVVVFGCAMDKDIDGMLREISLAADKIICTKVPGNARAADPADLQHRLQEMGKMSQTAPDVAGSLQLAARSVSREDLICITGSLHLVGEAKKHLAQSAAKK